MRLRKQLFIASLFTLSLPWLGCQYIREMEENLLAGQAEALLATAKAVAATIENDDELSTELSHFSAPAGARPIYLHPFYSPLILDGYNEDWVSYGYLPQAFQTKRSPQTTMLVYGGLRGEEAWLFFHIPSPAIDYYNPSQSPLSADRLKLSLRGIDGESKSRLVMASGPGRAQVYDEQNAIDRSINAIWRETANGFQVEVQIPFAQLGGGFSFEVLQAHSKEAAYGNVADSEREKRAPIPNYIAGSLKQSLAIFERDGIRLNLVSRHAAIVASSGKLDRSSKSQNIPWVLSFLFRVALSNEKLPNLPNPNLSGYFTQSDVLESLNGRVQTMRYNLRGLTVSTVSLPVRKLGRVIGSVHLEQNARSLSNYTDHAFSRLLLYSLSVSFGSALILVLYASWLSFRIRRLSKSAIEAISETGKINDGFNASQLNDEVGDLSRSFSQLLSRLKEYTHYLKTLSSKLSHELRTPLAIVSSSLDNLEHEDLPKQAKIYAQRAKEGSARLSSILNSMSAASRVEQSIGSAEIEKIPLDELLGNLRAAYADVYAHVNVELKLQEHKDGFVLDASGELLVQMLDKLVDNAADFCPDGGLIELGLYREQNEFVITVRNEGPLLPQVMHQQLFDSMVSVRQTRHQEVESNHHLGLGLYIVRLIVDFHQGSVQGYNVPDKTGVIFEIRLPINI